MLGEGQVIAGRLVNTAVNTLINSTSATKGRGVAYLAFWAGMWVIRNAFRAFHANRAQIRWIVDEGGGNVSGFTILN